MLPPKLILSPVDFSEHSEDALRTATELAVSFGAELCLAHVVPAIPKLASASELFHEGEYEQELHKEAEAGLTELVRQAAQRGISARFVVGTANDVGGELLLIAKHNLVDLIVISTHGMTGWHQLAFGSVADKVVRLAHCPVLVLRAQTATQSSETKAGYSRTAATV